MLIFANPEIAKLPGRVIALVAAGGLAAALSTAAGLSFTFLYISWFKLCSPESNVEANWLFGISPEGIGVIGMLLNFAVAIAVARFTSAPSKEIGWLVDKIRVPRA